MLGIKVVGEKKYKNFKQSEHKYKTDKKIKKQIS